MSAQSGRDEAWPWDISVFRMAWNCATPFSALPPTTSARLLSQRGFLAPGAFSRHQAYSPSRPSLPPRRARDEAR